MSAITLTSPVSFPRLLEPHHREHVDVFARSALLVPAIRRGIVHACGDRDQLRLAGLQRLLGRIETPHMPLQS